MEDDKKLQEEFIQFLAQQLDAKTEQDLTQKVKKLGKEGIKKYYDAFVQYKQKQAKKAAHGTKLTYFKHLKNQCSEGEEVVYYKVGGRVGCGCKKIKKAQVGAEVSQPKFKKKSTSINSIEKPTPKKKFINPDDTVQLKKIGIRDLTPTGRTGYKKLVPSEYRNATDEEKNRIDEKDSRRGRQIFEKGSKIKKNCGGVKLAKKGEKVCPKCGKVHSAGMGCAVAKFKKHYQGGSLNGVPFYQKAGKLVGKQKSVNDYYLTDYSEPDITQKVKLNGKEITIKVNKGQQKGEDPITIQGNNYYLKGDSTLVKDNSIPYSFEQLRNSGIKKKAQGGNLNNISFLQKAGKLIDPLAEEAKARAQRNAQNRADAKGMFKGMVSGQIVPTLSNLGRMIGSAYKGWIDPEVSPYLNTGVAPTTGTMKRIPSLNQMPLKYRTQILKQFELESAKKLRESFPKPKFKPYRGEKNVEVFQQEYIAPDGTKKTILITPVK